MTTGAVITIVSVNFIRKLYHNIICLTRGLICGILRALQENTMPKLIDKKLHFYRRHYSNVTKGVGAKVMIKLKWRINLVVSLVIRYFKIKLNKSVR